MRWLLVPSLALNLLVLGLVVGDALSGGGPGRGPRPVEMSLGPVGRALEPQDRRAILGSLRGDPDLRPLGRGERAAGFAAVAQALRADPFDEGRLREALLAQSDRVAAAQRAVQEALLARLAGMTPGERAAFADRLEAEAGRGHRP
jgi:uncharacterized membrane protein